MATFGVKVKDCKEARQFFKETNERLQNKDMMINPFYGGVKKLRHYYLIQMKPVYPNFTLIVWFIFFCTVMVFGYKLYVHIPMVVVGLLGIFWTRHFFFFMMKKGLKKAGYNDYVLMVDIHKLIEEEVFSYGTSGDPGVPGKQPE